MMMSGIRAVALLLGMILAFNCNAEINIGVAIPNQGEIQGKAPKILDSRLKTAISTCGVSSTQWGDFFLVPTAIVLNEDLVEAAMANIYKVELDLTLSIEQLATGTNYGSETWSVKGTGKSRDAAILNAVSSWRGDSRFTQYIDRSKKAIEEYFTTNCQALINKAQQKAKAGEYEEALATLSSFPTNIPGAEKVLAEMNSIYDQMIAKDCGAALNQARSALAMSDYQTAAEYLANIDAMSPCASDAAVMQNKIRTSIAEDDQRQYQREQAELDRQERQENARMMSEERLKTASMQSNERRERARLKAISDVAKAYYGRKVVNNYHAHYHIW